MNLGHVTIIIAFVAALGAAFAFYRRGGVPGSLPPKSGNLARRLYLITAGAIVAASVILYVALLTHQYQYSYVAHYSSNTLPLLYIISSFWAGQEGTFLFWALLVAIMGMMFMRITKFEDNFAMSVVSGLIAFLALLMIVKSPFELTAAVPADGSGLNPLLQDPWMAIHPPILFMGYAATVFPFALVFSGLKRSDYRNWFASGFSWTLFASVTLGAGIIIGGFWAYEVLGWGGYWGWDPVENSSLVPWLVLLALIHGLIVQRSRGSLVRTNMALAILSFLLVLYATFLTRSGVLADFSVHSFVDLGINNYLIGAMVLATALGFGTFARRFSSVTGQKLEIRTLNRELTLLLSIYVLMAGAIFTFAGMSSPIITGFFGKASQVDTSFYNKVNLPVAIGMAILLGLTPFLGWTEERSLALVKRYSMPLALTALGTVIAVVAGVSSWALLLFIASATFGVASNAIIAFRQYRSGWMLLGGPMAHVGVGLLFLGIVGSGTFDESKKIVLKPGEPQQLYGYTFTFTGVTDPQAVKPRLNIQVSDGKNTYVATPRLYFSQYNQSVLREPDIKILPLKDLYISPIEFRAPASAEEHQHPTLELTKGEKKEVAGYMVTFARFETGQHGETGDMAVGAVLTVNAHGTDHEVMPQLVFNSRGERQALAADLPSLRAGTNGTDLPRIALTQVNVEKKRILLELVGVNGDTHEASIPELIVDISVKPLMMVVWTGVVLMIAGTLIGWRRRVVLAD